MTTLRRADFADAASFAHAMYEHGPSSSHAVWSYTRLGGWHGDVLRATWGDDTTALQEWRAFQRAEATARPHVLAEKLTRGRRASPTSPNSTLLSLDDVGVVLSAAEFAHEQGWLFGTSLTLSFKLMGACGAAQVKENLKRFLKCLGQWCRDNRLPRAYVVVVENSSKIGLHAHVALHVPVPARAAFRAWVEAWVRAECVRRGVAYQGNAWRLNRSHKEYPLTHYMLAHYLVKGCDSDAVAQAAKDAPDGRPLLLRDLLAYEHHDPGVVPFARLHIGASIDARARGEWRSAWDRGERDVNFLYPAEFLNYVRLRFPVATLSAAELAPVAAAALSLAQWCTQVKPLGDKLPLEVQGWQTVVERNVELVGAALWCVHTQFALAAAMRDPQDRRCARAGLRASLEAAHRAVNENGAEVASLVDEVSLPLGHLVVRRLAAAEVAVRELGALLDVNPAQPAWTLPARLDPLEF